jgi:hypothetical protein
MADAFSTFSPDLSSPCMNAAAVTPHNSTDLAQTSRALFVGGAGNLVAVMAGGTTVTFTGVVAGSILPIRVTRVNSTNTTATNIVSIY